jgi:hypothetical protein
MSDIVETIAARIGARHRPAYEAWRKYPGKPPEGVLRCEWGEFYMTEPGGADESTMVSFVAADGHTSVRSLTWREVVAEIVAELRADGLLAD